MSEQEHPDDGLLGSAERAVEHAEEAVRSYLALLAASVQRTSMRLLIKLVWLIVFGAIGVIGVAVLISGLMDLLDYKLNIPGTGGIIIGGGLLLIFLLAMVIQKAKNERK